MSYVISICHITAICHINMSYCNNVILQYVILHNVLKTAEVVPVFKKGERELCSNYRPISILIPFAKLFEKCLFDELNNYFVSNNLISPNQYGFKKNCSTNEAVLDIYNKLLDNMDKKLITCSIFLDLRKAYDIINHTILIKKLEKYGSRGLPLQLLTSYLTDSQQYTIANHRGGVLEDVLGLEDVLEDRF